MAKYRDLIVFQKADALAFSIYKATETFLSKALLSILVLLGNSNLQKRLLRSRGLLPKRCSKSPPQTKNGTRRNTKSIISCFCWQEKGFDESPPLRLGGDGGGELTPLNDGDTM